ncbi:unnamed protein product [Protopolystoma xenopodis]|uniref:Lysophospholipase NTE1-like P-loop domain-containing protein n=1 Tax=Protopolystoma xenopodis TaxID=117903 RepID=A0A448WZ00_9PLAT|nr:unnamed protein product [Protopolystoma xenopodis]
MFYLRFQFFYNLMKAFIFLSTGIILTRLGPAVLASGSEYRLTSWLSHQEDLHRIVLYVCDPYRGSAWNHRCIRQADCVLVLALATTGNPDRPTGLETALNNDPTKASLSGVLTIQCIHYLV